MINYDREKYQTWNFIMYPENMVDGWQEDFDELIGGYPYAYCIHDKDKDGHKGDRKDHLHGILRYTAPTTGKTVKTLLQRFSKPDKNCLLGIEPSGNIRHSYDYLIHDTKNARKKGKHLYAPSERVEGNCFDIGAYEQLSQQQKDEMLEEIIQFVVDREILDTRQFWQEFKANFEQRYFEIYKGYNAIIDRQIRGNYNYRERKKSEEKHRCTICGTKQDLSTVQYVNGRVIYTCPKHRSTVLALVDENLELMFSDEL